MSETNASLLRDDTQGGGVRSSKISLDSFFKLCYNILATQNFDNKLCEKPLYIFIESFIAVHIRQS